MIVGIVTLFSMLFGVGGQVDIFFLDNLDKGVKKYVVDKDRKKELQGILKDYTSTLKDFRKERKSKVKDLKEKNKDRSGTEEWFRDFFTGRIDEREELQAYWIEHRLELQEKIMPDEWALIIKMAEDEVAKLEAKEQKKARKQKDKDIFSKLETTINEQIADQGKRSEVMTALEQYEKKVDELGDNLKDINVTETDFLADQNATKEDMEKVARSINDLRKELYSSYSSFYLEVLENTTVEEWNPIMKEFNKMF